MTSRLFLGLLLVGAMMSAPRESAAGLIWRVDFDGAAGDTLAASNFTGWAISSTSRTQTFANVDGGAVSSNMVVVLQGSGGSWTAFQRDMNAGSATNLYRDGGQYTVSPVTVVLSNLAAGAIYQVRLWYFDDNFSPGITQTYVNVTGGGSVNLGALTNVATANLLAGNAGLPNNLYDARYCLTATLAAGAQGSLAISITPSSGNTKWNALEVMESAPPPPAITYSSGAFTESAANQGGLANTLSLTLARDEFTGLDGDDFILDGKATVLHVPAGLSVSLSREGTSNLVFSLTGEADVHASANSVSNLTLTLLDGAFVSADASQVEQASHTNLQILFVDAPIPVLTYNATVFQEAVANDGGIANGLTLTLVSDTFTGTNDEDFVVSGKASATQVPSGLTAGLVRENGTNLVFTLTGQAAAHASVDSIANLSLTVLDAAFTSGNATQVIGYSRADLHVNFADPAVPPATNGVWLVWSSVPDKRYTVEWSSNLVDFMVLASNVPGDLALTGLTSAPPPATASPVMYRVRVE